MKCAVLHGIGDVRMEERPTPDAGPGQLLVRMTRVGVCGSDVHYFTHGRIGDYVVREPLILGHESAGVVAAVGAGVSAFAVGDRVTLEPGYTCGQCTYCKTGHYNLCPDVIFMATPPVDGAFCEYVAWPANFCYRLPQGVSDEEGAMMEPLSVGMWAVQRGQVKPGDAVAVFGAGPIGLVTLQAARIAGATMRIAIDIEDFRLDWALKLGATHTINARRTDAVAEVMCLTEGRRGVGPAFAGVDVAFETAGAVPTTRNTLAATRRGGVAVLVGLPPEAMVELDIVSAASKEMDIRGMFRYANQYGPALAVVAAGMADVASLVTHHFSLEQVQEALRFADEFKSEALKVIIDITE